MNLKNLIWRGKPDWRKKQEPERSTNDQIKEVIETADQFDALVRMAGWEKVLRHMAAEVNGELLEAANKKYDREGRLMHCDMWQAKRELLDSAVAYIESIQNERDRIVSEYKEQVNG